jgi:hypothetical protein
VQLAVQERLGELRRGCGCEARMDTLSNSSPQAPHCSSPITLGYVSGDTG